MFYTRNKEHAVWASMNGLNLRIDNLFHELNEHKKKNRPKRITKHELMKRWGIDSNRDFDLLVSYYPITPMSFGSSLIPRVWFGTKWEHEGEWKMRDVREYEGKHAFLGRKMWDMIAEAHALEESRNDR